MNKIQDCESCKFEITSRHNEAVVNWIIPLPNITWGKISRIIDGDTCEVIAPVWPEKTLTSFRIRLAGIQCPEVSNKAGITAEERNVGMEAKFLVQQKWLGRMVHIQPTSYELYQRLMARLIDEEGVCINDWLVQQHLAVPWDGKAKLKNMDWKNHRASRPQE